MTETSGVKSLLLIENRSVFRIVVDDRSKRDNSDIYKPLFHTKN